MHHSGRQRAAGQLGVESKAEAVGVSDRVEPVQVWLEGDVAGNVPVVCHQQESGLAAR